MFAYCLNNPISRIDASGSISTVIVQKLVKAVIGGIISAIAEHVTGGTFTEVVQGFAEGFSKTIISDFSNFLKGAVVVYDVITTITECYNSGATLGNALLAGTVQLLSSVVALSDFGVIFDTLLDMTLGLGLSTLSTGFKKSIIADVSKPQNPKKDATNSVPKSTSGQVSFSVTPGYRPSYTGFGFHPAGYTLHNGIRIPCVSNASRVM